MSEAVDIMTDEADEGAMAAELRAGAARLVADRTDHRRTRSLRKTIPGYDQGLFETFADLGWLGVLVPEAHGGVGLGLGEMAAIVRELEKGLISEPMIPVAVLAARALVHGGGRLDLLESLVGGESRPALALGFDAEPPPVAAKKTGGGFLLEGACASVAGGAGATHFLVPAKAADGWRVFVVPADVRGIEQRTLWRADETPLAQLTLVDVEISGDAVAAGTETALDAVSRAVDETRIVASAGLVGLAEKMLAMTVEYMGVRKQFDQPIGAFQALQHKAVDLYIEKERAAAVLDFALDAAKDPAMLRIAAMRAKGRASLAASRIAREALQLHGAIGYTEEHDLGLYLKRAVTLSAWLGNASDHRRRYVEMGLAAS